MIKIELNDREVSIAREALKFAEVEYPELKVLIDEYKSGKYEVTETEICQVMTALNMKFKFRMVHVTSPVTLPYAMSQILEIANLYNRLYRAMYPANEVLVSDLKISLS